MKNSIAGYSSTNNKFNSTSSYISKKSNEKAKLNGIKYLCNMSEHKKENGNLTTINEKSKTKIQKSLIKKIKKKLKILKKRIKTKKSKMKQKKRKSKKTDIKKSRALTKTITIRNKNQVRIKQKVKVID